MADSETEDFLVATQDCFSIEQDKNADTEVLDDDLEEELYADLTMDIKQEMDYNELKKLFDESRMKVQELSKENQALKEQNIILKKNISSLYLTAKEEIQRKDAQLKALQEKEDRRKQYYAQKMEKTSTNN
ncbi:stress response protein NST1-like [Actinia tenebrosa]|uniref:Stress response protein NST1-like n=1 Tax=Actinia tenebrosa TaxID=6105 RepID=A0A6P8IIN7_ACTTE|nr:stress response protein NST1-like [Actinia tenebrosa]